MAFGFVQHVMSGHPCPDLGQEGQGVGGALRVGAISPQSQTTPRRISGAVAGLRGLEAMEQAEWRSRSRVGGPDHEEGTVSLVTALPLFGT
jgi:hypothetical protein